ncbi:MAG: methylated-DNA--[protein]-cysteine S-methyltransferase [Lachnospiraceae bacterium]|jgi:methylated-DNA-[protein]-cysteine S-methyltransferase|nr:methylated-DNA--[protein]-cysteine S-methyltransferase [Lachnospiraceae bacterium]
MLYTMYYDSPLGRFLLAEKDQALVGLWMEGQKYFPGSFSEETKEIKEIKEIKEVKDFGILNKTKGWLDAYFKGEKPSIRDLTLAPVGSGFRKEVWKLLCEIPYGEVVTYKEIAEKLARSRGLAGMSAQAVGGAVSHNPISVIIPCHRVVGANGSLTGYAGGLERKRKLLTLEGVDLDKFFIPARGTAL